MRLAPPHTTAPFPRQRVCTAICTAAAMALAACGGGTGDSNAPVASAQEQVIDRQADRERMEREIRAELERERAAAPKPQVAAATGDDSGRYMMQCAALRSQDSAESLKARIAFGAGLSSSLQVVNGANGTVYKVMVGPFSGKAAVDAANRKLQGSGISGCIPKKG